MGWRSQWVSPLSRQVRVSMEELGKSYFVQTPVGFFQLLCFWNEETVHAFSGLEMQPCRLQKFWNKNPPFYWTIAGTWHLLSYGECTRIIPRAACLWTSVIPRTIHWAWTNAPYTCVYAITTFPHAQPNFTPAFSPISDVRNSRGLAHLLPCSIDLNVNKI